MKTYNISVEYTCIKYNGCSVVDFCIASWPLYDCIQNFYVNEFTHKSDHIYCPITCTINCNIGLCSQTKSKSKKHAIYKYIWDDESKNKFVNILNSDSMKSQIKNFMNTKFSDSNVASKALENVIIFAADQSLSKSR